MARISGSARRYAAAIFEIARETSSIDAWLADLTRLVDLLLVPEAEQALTSPAVPEAERIAAVHRLLPGLSRPVLAFVEILIRRGRLELLPEVLLDFQRRVDELRGVVTVEVTTAVPLGSDEARLLSERLSRYTGKQVRLEPHVDPTIIGGVIARIGDELIDDSVRGRLDRLRRRLEGGVGIA